MPSVENILSFFSSRTWYT